MGKGLGSQQESISFAETFSSIIKYDVIGVKKEAFKFPSWKQGSNFQYLTQMGKLSLREPSMLTNMPHSHTKHSNVLHR